ncbi:MAG: rhodanese-like domain-containing protein [Actinomycetota bacterium]|nr:rhodanese-like domain-containing protein [Actinomycetota bacterium]
MFGAPQVPAVTPAQVPEDAWVLDVREPEEWVAGHVEGAHHVPLYELPQRLDDVPADREVVVVCKVGGRSAQATAWLRAQGRTAVNLDGGMWAWAAAGRPMVAEHPGEPYVA